MRLMERRPLFEDQPVCRDVFRAYTDGPVKGLRPVTRALTGQAEHHVQIDVAETGLAHQPKGSFSLGRRMGATDPMEQSVLNSLDPYTRTGHPALPQCTKLRKIHRPRIDLEADLCAVLEGEGSPTVIEDADKLRCMK